MLKPEDIVFKLEFVNTYVNNVGDKVDLWIMYYDSRTNEGITLCVPHGREDIAQYIQERLK
jgi:hypothetical protein